MSIETIQAAPESTDRLTHKQPCEREFEEFFQQAVQGQGDEPLSLRAWLDLAEAWKITRTLRACGGNRSAAARALGIGRRTLYAKMDKLQITPTWALGRGPASTTRPR
jgi:DNA-binding NtrC family response regulator